MRSTRGLLAAACFLLVIPIALLNSVLLGIDAEVTVHFVAAGGFALLALAVFDSRTPTWIAWLASAAARISAVTYLLQGVSNLAPNHSPHFLAFTLLGHQPPSAL